MPIDQNLLAKAREMAGSGMSNRSVARELGVHHKTVGRWLAQAAPAQTAQEALVADLIAMQPGAAGAGLAPVAGRGLASLPGTAIELAPSQALDTIRRGGLARQVIDAQVLGEAGPGAGVQRLATYTRPAASGVSQLALQAGEAGGALGAAPRAFAMGPASSGAGSVAANIASSLGAAGGGGGGLAGGAGAAASAAGAGAGGAGAAAAAGGAEAAASGGLAALLKSKLTPVVTRGSLMRAAGYAGAGYYGGQLTDKLIGEHSGSSLDEAATGAVTGAGIGAAAGSIVPGIGTGVGALVGGGIGGLIGAFGPKTGYGVTPANAELAKQMDALNKLAGQAGLDQDSRSLLAAQLQGLGAQIGDKTSTKQIREAAGQIIGQVPLMAAEAAQQRKRQSQALAMQAVMAPILQRYLDRVASSSRESQVVMNDAASRLPADLADIYRARGAQYVSDADAMNAALAAQVVNQPNAQLADLQRQIQNQASSQTIAALAAQLSGTGGQASSLEQLLAG